jgi:hypothetical protein
MLRANVIYAATWRVLAELLRRHGAAQDLHVGAAYPGLSPTGFFHITRGLCRSFDPSHAQPRLDLWLGGGCCAQIHASTPFGPPRASSDDVSWRDVGYAHALLGSDDPKSVVDTIEALAGLPPVAELPPSTDAALVARVIAAALEARMLDRRLYRTSAGYLDHDGTVAPVAELARVPELWSELGRVRADPEALRQLLGNIWIVHEGTQPLGSGTFEPCQPVVFDFRDAKAWAPASSARPVDLAAMYRDHGRRLRPLLAWVDDALVPPQQG